MVAQKWVNEPFKLISVLDSYFCWHYDTAKSLPSREIVQLPKFLQRNIRKFVSITEFSLCCRWWYTERGITAHVRSSRTPLLIHIGSSPPFLSFSLFQARSDPAWVPALFPLARLNAHQLTRLEIQDYDSMSENRKLDPIDELIAALGPNLKQLCLLNVWITEATVQAIRGLKCSLDLFSVEGSSFSERIRAEDRNDLIDALLTSPAVASVKAIRLTWSIMNQILDRLPNGRTFPNIAFLDYGVSVYSSPISSVSGWESIFRELSDRIPAVNLTCVLKKHEDLLCDAVTSPSFTSEILDFFLSKGFTPELYRDVNYFEGDGMRVIRQHPIVSALRVGNLKAASLLVSQGFMTVDLSNSDKMRILSSTEVPSSGTATPPVLRWISEQAPDVIKFLLPVGATGIGLFCSATSDRSRLAQAVAMFLVDHPEIATLIQVDMNLELSSPGVTIAGLGQRTSRST